MSDQVNTIDQLNKLFRGVVITALGMSEAAWLAYKAAIDVDETSWTDPVPDNPYEWVRISWQTEGQPAWSVLNDVCFISCIEEANIINELRENVLDEGDETTLDSRVQYTRFWAVKFVFYGPNSSDNARKVKSALYKTDALRTIGLSNCFLVPTNQIPKRVPEQYSGLWYERVDLTMYFNENVIEESTVPFMAAADIKIFVDNGMERDITVTAATGG